MSGAFFSFGFSFPSCCIAECLANTEWKFFNYVQEVGVRYAFVEFEDITGVQNAVKVVFPFQPKLQDPTATCLFIKFES